MFTIKSLDELARYFTDKAREMNDIAQQRIGLQKHHYNGQAHAYNDCAITTRNCKLEGKRKHVKATHTNSVMEGQHNPAGKRQTLLDDN